MSGTEAFKPIAQFLNGLIQEHGDTLFMIFVFVAIPFLIWVLSGGMRRKWPQLNRQPTVIIIPPIGPSSTQSRPLVILRGDDENEST